MFSDRVQYGTSPLVRLGKSLEYSHQSQAFALKYYLDQTLGQYFSSRRSSIGSNKRGKQAGNNGKQVRPPRRINEQKVVGLVTDFWRNHETD